MALGDLSAAYESNGNPGCVSSGAGDLGGISYGAYQLASSVGSVDEFISWGIRQGGFYTDYANALNQYDINSDAFIQEWKSLAETDYNGFLQMQHDYIKSEYYDTACRYLANEGFHADNHSKALQDVIWSRAVQYGPGNVVDLFNEALRYVPGYTNEWNLSWVDALRFDYDLIVGVYESNKTDEWISDSLSEDVYEGVYNRMEEEKQEALAMFTKEIQ
jgi:hypothetical protein